MPEPAYLAESAGHPMGRPGCARRCERTCCTVATYFPLAFVYGVTTWAVWVEASIGFRAGASSWTAYLALLGMCLYALLNWSYTVAVFTPPGSPIDTPETAGYASLPTHEPSRRDITSFTVKSTGELRYCKKCQSRKPDRAHHCSTCQRCVLKMDHHCPWLATCVGLRNYKAFLLFLVYTSFYCWLCFGISSAWLWAEAFTDSDYIDSLMPINNILLCVIAGIIGLVLTGFTAWHISLALRGMTTIECLEHTRYLSPLRQALRKQDFGKGSDVAGTRSYGQQLAEIHANMVPSVTREEEGETLSSSHLLTAPRVPSAKAALQNNYAELERSRERDRYADYLDERDAGKLPNAFNHGWRHNLVHLLGETPYLRLLPICNTTGDGWRWEASAEWVQAREQLKAEREAKWHRDQHTSTNGHVDSDSERHYLGSTYDGADSTLFDQSRSSRDRPSSGMSMKTIRRQSSFESDVDSYLSTDDDSNRMSASLQHAIQPAGSNKQD